ncbi:MAG: DUF29 domain-containing protein [Spirosomataceae bacterium]
MTTAINWEELVTTSHLEAVTQIKRLIEEQAYEEAHEGVETLRETMSRSERKALASQLRRLMLHILKWKYQPQKRSLSWVRSIVDARNEIADLKEYMPTLNNQYIKEIWEDCSQKAIEGAKAEMNLSRKDIFEPVPLTWHEVFDDEYLL